jgi:hypothetical protein
MGLDSAVVGMLHRQLQSRITSVRALSKQRRDVLNRRLWRECLRLQVKKEQLAKIARPIASLRSASRVAAAGLLEERTRLVPAESKIVRLKRKLERVFRLRERQHVIRARRYSLARSIHYLKRSIQKIASSLKFTERQIVNPALANQSFACHHDRFSGNPSFS